jgi:hypothetical protein
MGDIFEVKYCAADQRDGDTLGTLIVVAPDMIVALEKAEEYLSKIGKTAQGCRKLPTKGDSAGVIADYYDV